jgi:hypothetical protein
LVLCALVLAARDDKHQLPHAALLSWFETYPKSKILNPKPETRNPETKTRKPQH